MLLLCNREQGLKYDTSYILSNQQGQVEGVNGLKIKDQSTFCLCSLYFISADLIHRYAKTARRGNIPETCLIFLKSLF